MLIANNPTNYQSGYYGEADAPPPAGDPRTGPPPGYNPTIRLALDLASGATNLSQLSEHDLAAFQSASANLVNMLPETVMADTAALMMVALEFATKLKETTSLFKETASQKAIQEHLESAAKAFEAAEAQWKATMVEGVSGVLAGAVETGGAAASLRAGLKGGEAELASANHKKNASDIDAEAPPGQLTLKDKNEISRLDAEIQSLQKQMSPKDIEAFGGTNFKVTDLSPSGRKLYEDEIIPRRQRIDEIQRMPQQRAEAIRQETNAAEQAKAKAGLLHSKETAILALARGIAQLIKAISQFPEGQFTRESRELDAKGKLDMASGEGWEALARNLGDLVTQLQALLQSAQDGAKTVQQTTRDTDSAINHIA
ncbi:MAG: hypothetical protein AB7P37_02095 [Ramlibacter sp.]